MQWRWICIYSSMEIPLLNAAIPHIGPGGDLRAGVSRDAETQTRTCVSSQTVKLHEREGTGHLRMTLTPHVYLQVIEERRTHVSTHVDTACNCNSRGGSRAPRLDHRGSSHPGKGERAAALRLCLGRRLPQRRASKRHLALASDLPIATIIVGLSIFLLKKFPLFYHNNTDKVNAHPSSFAITLAISRTYSRS